jgi:hypothetical protein
MAVFSNTEHPKALKSLKLNGSYRPEAEQRDRLTRPPFAMQHMYQIAPALFEYEPTR